MGLSVVSQTLCKMDVFPAFVLPIIRTRNRIFGIRGRGCCVSIGATVFGKERAVDRFDPVLDRWFTRFTFLIHRTQSPGSGNPIIINSCQRLHSKRPDYCRSVLRSYQFIPPAQCIMYHWVALSRCLIYHCLRPEYTHRCIERLARPTTSAFYSCVMSYVVFP